MKSNFQPLSVAVLLSLAACSSGKGESTEDVVADAVETDVLDEDTVGVCEDDDDDGFGRGCAAGLDCDDSDPLSFPGASEACGDDRDNNCDSQTDEGCSCLTGQSEQCYDGPDGTAGVGRCVAGNRICEDGEWSACLDEVLPASDDETACDFRDEDCDGQVDEGLTNACGQCGPVSNEICGDGLDNNCDGSLDEASAGCDCEGRSSQPCYSGPPQTLGLGACRGGTADCESDGLGACLGQILPQPEACDGIDNDCDGFVDEGLRNACGVCGAPEPAEVCDSVDNDCDGTVDDGVLLACGLCAQDAGEEECGDGFDNDCDGSVDEGCPCSDGTASCYPGPIGTLGNGRCAAGTRECGGTGETWTECTGFVLPTVEVCDGEDNDCDGVIDGTGTGCSVCGGSAEVCDGTDNDCDGVIDDGVANRCGICLEDVVPESECNGLDDDCDGLIDEGLVNACGLCDGSCFVGDWRTPEDWIQGEFEGIDSENLESGLRLGAARFTYPDLWIANSDDSTVTRVNTDSARVVATFPVGLNPSRTAVDFDGNVWVANRAFEGQGSVTKILASGCTGLDCVAFTTDIGNINDIPRGLAIDSEGFIWVGTYTDGTLRRIDPETGVVVETYNIRLNIYGLAIDSEGIIWISTLNTTGIGAFDTNTNRFIGTYRNATCTTPYGISIDGNGNVWAGSYHCNSLLRIRRAEIEGGDLRVDSFSHPNLTDTRGLAVDGDGFVYVAASGTNRLGKFNPTTETFEWTIPVCAEPIGVGIASDGNIWVVCQDANETRRYSPEGLLLGTVGTGNGPYSYSDLTGFQLRNFTAPRGTWRVNYDCGYEVCTFDRLSWDAVIPAGVAIRGRVRTRTADSTEDDWSAWSAYFDPSPAAISGQVPDGRYCQIEILMTTTDRDISGLVRSVTLDWQRP